MYISIPQLPFLEILSISLVLTIVAFFMNNKTQKNTRIDQTNSSFQQRLPGIIIFIILPVFATLASLLIKYQTIGGTIEQEHWGWPHRYVGLAVREVVDNIEINEFFLFHNYLFYFFINVLFYSSIFYLLKSLWSFLLAKRKARS